MSSTDTYRYYRLNGTGHLAYAEWFSAASDDDAVTQIEIKYPRERSEVWLGTRLVARLSPTQFDADDHDLQEAVGDRLSALALKMGSGQ